MTVVAWVFAVVAGLFHLAAFVMESLLFDRPSVQRALVGVIVWAAGQETVGMTLVVFSCAAMTLAGVVLFVSDRRLWRGAVGQALPPAIAIVAALAS
jgi:putative membrane protein